jgi:elongation factor P
MYQISDLKKGVCIDIDGVPYQVVEYQHVKVARQAGMMATKLKNLQTGSIIEKTYKSGDKVKPADVGYRKCQYLYPDGDGFMFMNAETYEQFTMSADEIGDMKEFMIEGADVDIQYFGEKPIGLLLPPNMIFEVIETVPGVKGDNATGGSKPATIVTGKVVNVPLFIQEGDKIKVDTRTGEYMERYNK